jgi:hypothetical protein
LAICTGSLRAKSNISPKRFLASDAPNVFIIISPRKFIGYYDYFSYYSQNEGDRSLSSAKPFSTKKLTYFSQMCDTEKS